MNPRRVAEAQRARASVLARKDLPWMRGVVATAIGPKVVNGRFEGTPALHLVVPKKVPRGSLTLKRIIPPEIDGIPTDVIRQDGELLAEPSFAPADAVEIGYGTAVVSDVGEQGTLGAVGRRNGQTVLITAGHVAPPGSETSLRDAPGTDLGGTVATLDLASGAQLYGGWATDPNENFFLDIAVIAAKDGLPLQGGLPGSSSFKVAPNTASLVAGLAGSRVLALGAGAGGWRMGTVTGIWARPTNETATGLCFVQHDPGSLMSSPGDSGSVWLLRSGMDFIALGLHWGLVGNLAWVTDLTASLPLLGVEGLAGDPGAP
jgi:hypothetical protein